MVQSTKIKFLVYILTISWINAQEYIENLHDSKFGTHIKEIPKSFEVRGYDANSQFQKYFDQIQEIAMQENLNVLYKIKLEVEKPTNYHPKRPITSRKGKSKKYNIPLKKTSMKLSNFEVWLRKMAEQSGANKKGQQKFEMFAPVTTEGEKIITTTKPIQLKYKPIISRIKTNYAKFVKPVRSRTITLTK